MSQHVLFEVSEGVATLTLNRPEKKNALTVEMYQALVDALARAEADPKARVIRLRATGDAFTSGNDLGDFMNTPPAGKDSPVFALLTALVDLQKVLVAEVRGAAIGIGTTLLFHCDLVYAAQSARLQMPFVNLGLCPEGGSSYLLPRFLGQAKAAELLLFGDAFGAEEAARLGIVNQVFADEDLAAAVGQRVAALVQKPAASLRATKALLRQEERAALREAMWKEGALFLERLASPEAAEAFTAFFEKRKADFSRFD